MRTLDTLEESANWTRRNRELHSRNRKWVYINLDLGFRHTLPSYCQECRLPWIIMSACLIQWISLLWFVLIVRWNNFGLSVAFYSHSHSRFVRIASYLFPRSTIDLIHTPDRWLENELNHTRILPFHFGPYNCSDLRAKWNRPQFFCHVDMLFPYHC